MSVKREVFLQIPSRTPNPKSNDKNSEKGGGGNILFV